MTRRSRARSRVKVVRTTVTFKSTVTENGEPRRRRITTSPQGKKVGGATGSFTFKAGKSATLNATGVDSDTGVGPDRSDRAADDLFYHDLGTAACTKTPIFGGLPCVDATLGGASSPAPVRQGVQK